MIWPDSFVEHLTGGPGNANEELFNYLVSALPPRRRDAVLLHFHDCLPYKTVGAQMGGVSATRAMQQAAMGLRTIRERIAMDTEVVPHPNNKPEYGETLRRIVAGTVEDYLNLIAAKELRKAAAEAKALEAHSADSIDSLSLNLPTYRALVAAGITTVGVLVAKTEAELQTLGRVNIAHIQSRLGNLGLKLATPVNKD